MIMSTDIYYRPEWTCGKYNATNHVAIMFNLLMNGEYFFENESADVVGIILGSGRNGEVRISNVSKMLNIAEDCIIPFFNQLLEIGLLIDKLPTKNDIYIYRKYCLSQSNTTKYIGDKLDGFLQCGISSVEQAYADAVADCTKITSVIFELTYRCNEKCLHCYNPGATRNDSEKSTRGTFSELTLNDYKRIIDEMCDAGLVTATLTGGDPFLYNDIWHVIEYLYQKDIAITILTNGQKIVNQIKQLADLYPRSIRLSLYSENPEIHDKITRKVGSWQTSINTITALREMAIPVVINCVIMRPCVKSYMGLKKIAQSLSCAILFDYCVVDSIDGDVCATHNLRLTPEELLCVMMDPDIEPKTKDGEMYSNPAPATKGAPCLAGRGTFAVMPDGKLIPCVSMHMILGDLKRTSFYKIIKNNIILKKMLEAKECDYIECGSHDYCSHCFFCAGNSFSEHNYPFRANENNCYIAKNRHKLVMLLKSGIDPIGGHSVSEIIESYPDYTFSLMSRKYKKG